MGHTPVAGSQEETAIAMIQDKGSMRSYVLAKELGMDHAAVLDLLDEATACGLLFACDVLVEGLPPGKEYRPGCGLPSSALSRREFTINPRKGQPWRHESAAPTAAPKTPEAETTKESAAEIPNNEIEQENTMPTPREAAAKQLASSLQVTRAVPARGFKAKHDTGQARKKSSPKPAASGRKSERQEQIIAALEKLGRPATIDQLAQVIPDASRSAIKQACLKAEKLGRILATIIKGRTKAFRCPGMAPGETKADKGETKSRESGTKVRKSVTPPRADAPKKLQQRTAKAPGGVLPAMPESAHPPGAMPLERPAFRCGVMSDGALVLDGDFAIADTGIVLTCQETHVLVEYLRRLEMLGAAQ